ncbi:MAG: hypothetical protein IJI51_03565 [Lachnospiraceae bacterium]|nr:hypothetical protein [Lachnospiraceae bacterium]
MVDYRVDFTDGTTEVIKAWDQASAWEFAQDIYGKAIADICRIYARRTPVK